MSLSAPSSSSTAVSLNKSSVPLAAVTAPEEGTAYKASGRSEASGLPKLLLAGVISGVLVGLLYFFVAQFINFILIFPLIAGALVGFGLTFAVKSGKVRNARRAGMVGVLAGLLMMGTMHMARAWSARPDLIDGFTQFEMEDLAAQAPGKTALSASQLAAREKTARAEVAANLTPFNTLYIYERLAAAQGTSIGRAGSSSTGANLPIKGAFYWLLRVGELLAVVLASGAIASSAAGEPFCESCNKWQEDEALLKVHPAQNAQVWEKIGARDWDNLMAMKAEPATDDKNVTTVKITHCPDCQSGTIHATSAGGKVPTEFNNRVLAPASTRVLLEKAQTAKRVSTA